ncbi:hypothetical protein SMUL_1019 [Sulfurospirillum multivorans DSM 12446]|uniref:DUF2062 domain-containing protein n=1 Tax=Sulfurospirillum multivorans (strain DM 12446 / JCM 15788 / NBRC 109480) TaxID=1150621 RepID=A0AA86DZB7_SULMK|nr:hypothetical protein SMUL_1019 [Sulfurospirillum multivorans DSM 12446]
MVKKLFKKNATSSKFDAFIEKYNIPKEYLFINRKMVTRALLIGISIGLIPMPFQMLLVVGMIFFVKFNVPIALLMVWLSNPLTMPFMYYAEYKTGVYLLGMDQLVVELSLEWFENHFSSIFLPLYTGTLFYICTLAPLVYFGVDWLWIRSVRKQRRLASKEPFHK